MKISDFMSPVPNRQKKSGRASHTYRVMRRNVARVKYRLAKKELKRGK